MNPIKTVTRAGGRTPLLNGLFVSIIWLAAGALLLSLLLRYSGMEETSLPALALGAHGLAALAGGFTSGKRAGRKGWYYGVALGCIYALLIAAVGFLAADAPLSADTLALFGTAAGAGTIGGMFGVGAGASR